MYLSLNIWSCWWLMMLLYLCYIHNIMYKQVKMLDHGQVSTFPPASTRGGAQRVSCTCWPPGSRSCPSQMAPWAMQTHCSERFEKQDSFFQGPSLPWARTRASGSMSPDSSKVVHPTAWRWMPVLQRALAVKRPFGSHFDSCFPHQNT